MRQRRAVAGKLNQGLEAQIILGRATRRQLLYPPGKTGGEPGC